MKHIRKVLPNGLKLIMVPMPSFQSVTVMVMVGAGSRYETKENNGISHFLEHMPFKGTHKRPSPMAIASLVDGIGGEWNAFTGKETTAYYIKSANTHLELSIDVLSDLLKHSLFDPQEIEKEKGVIIEEINMYEDMPMRNLSDVYESLLYGDTPMGWDTAGTKEVIQSVTREFFTQYMAKLYSSDNMTVVVSGGIIPDEVEKLVEEYFGDMEKFSVVKAEKVDDTQDKPAVFIKQKKTEQVHIALGVRTVPLVHSDRYALDVLASILGGSTSSRLFYEVRDKRGLGYYVRASSDNYTDCGTLVASVGVDPKRTDETIKVIMEQLAIIRDSTVTQEEFVRAKELMKGHLVLDMEDSRSVASAYALQEMLEYHLEDLNETIDHIDKVTIDDIVRVTKKYLIPSTLNLAIIGNFSDRQHFEELLKL